MTKRIALYGGSFNPPHVAHLLAVAYVQAMHPSLDEVWVMPCWSHAFAKDLARFEDRFEMCRRNFASLDRVRIVTVEAELRGQSRTIRTVRHLLQRYPSYTFRLMIGSDVLSDVDRWESFDELVTLAPPIVVDRLGHERGRRSFIPAVSSSEIRSAMAADQAQRVADMLVPTVEQYVRERGLYRSPEPNTPLRELTS